MLNKVTEHTAIVLLTFADLPPYSENQQNQHA